MDNPAINMGVRAANAQHSNGAHLPKRNAGQNNFAQSFAQIVAVLMRDRQFRDLKLADLEWLVLPPIMVGQFGLAHTSVDQSSSAGRAVVKSAKEKSSTLVPVAVALWARVSGELNKVFSDPLATQPKLQLSDWTSGEHAWLIATAGDPRAVPTFLEQVAAKEFNGNGMKMRVRSTDGKFTVKVLGQSGRVAVS
jgi:cytolysin-activating lysine-acyltransferase